MREEQAAMMRMISGLAGERFHRKMPGYHQPGSRAQRIDIRLVSAGREEKTGVGLMPDLHQNPVRLLCEFHLGAQRQGEK